MSQRVALSVILPAYREADTIEEALQKLFIQLSTLELTFEVIVVIDGDVDKTAEILEKLELPNLRIILLKKNEGKGAALRYGISSAIANDFIGYMDADLDLEPNALKNGIKLLAENTELDLVVGSKLHPNSVVAYPFFRKIQSHLYRLLVRSLFNLKISDTQTGIKVGRANVMKICMPKSGINGFAFDLSLLVRASQLNYRLSEVPIELNYQFESTVRLKSAYLTILDTFKVYFHSRERNERNLDGQFKNFE